MNFITLTKQDASKVIVDCYNIAIVSSGTQVELYKGDDLTVTETVDEVNALLATAKQNAV